MAEAPAGKARALALQVFIASWLSYAGLYCTRKVFSVVKGPIRDVLHVDDLRVSYLFTIYLVAYMVGMFVAAWLTRRMANRTVLLFGMGVSVACNVLLGLLLGAPRAWTYEAIAIVMGVQGLAQSTGWPCNIGLIALWTRRDQRGKVMALWGTCYLVGSVGARALAAFLFGAFGLLWSFWGSAIVLAVVTALFYFFVHETPESCGLPAFDDEPEPAARIEAGAGADDAARPALDRQRLSILFAMGLIYFGFKFLRYAIDSWSVLIVTERFAMSTERAGYLTTIFDLVGFVGVIFAGWVSDRVGSRLAVSLAMTLGLVVATAFMWRFGLGSATVFAATLAVVGFMGMGPDSLLAGAAAMDAGSRRQAAIGAAIINGCGSAGPIVQEPVLGWLKTTHGSSAILLVLLGVACLSAMGVWGLWRHTRRLGIRV